MVNYIPDKARYECAVWQMSEQQDRVYLEAVLLPSSSARTATGERSCHGMEDVVELNAAILRMKTFATVEPLLEPIRHKALPSTTSLPRRWLSWPVQRRGGRIN